MIERTSPQPKITIGEDEPGPGYVLKEHAQLESAEPVTANHAQGPWQVHDKHMNGYQVVHDAEDNFVCKVHRGAITEKTSVAFELREANARLIARAPELLQENKRLRECLEMLIQWDEFGGDAPEMLIDTVKFAKELIE